MSAWTGKLPGFVSWAICTAYIGLFFDIPVSNITLFVLLIGCLFTITIRGTIDSIKSSISIQLLISFYLLHMIGLLYSENLDNGLFVLEKKATLLALPLILFPAVQRFSAHERSNLLFRLGIITVASSIVFLGIGAFKIWMCRDPLAFHRDYFASIPYVYYSIYFATGCLLLLHSVHDRLPNSRIRMLILLVLIIYSLGILVLIASKTGILAYITGLAYLLYKKLSSKRVFYVSMAGAMLSLTLWLSLYPTTLNRFTELTKNLKVIQEDTLTHYEEFTGLNLRLFFWKASVSQLWSDHRMIAGIGTGDGQDYLDMAYTKRGLDKSGYLGFDPHNQWVITLLQLGLMGVGILGAVLVTAWIKAKRQFNIDFHFFAWVVFCFSLSESILEANKGIVFFALFFCVLCQQGEEKAS